MALDPGDLARYGSSLLGGGIIGALLTRVYDVRARRHDLLVENRRKRIAEWRVALNDAQSFEDMRHTSVWAELREHMGEERAKEMYTIWAVMSGTGGDGDLLKVMRLHEVVNEVERKWELI